MSGLNDKALSVGENSKIKIRDSIIKNSKLGIALKDNSKINKNKIIFKNNEQDEMKYIKKHFYTTNKYLNDHK